MTAKQTAPCAGDTDENTLRYLSYKQLHERLFLSRTQTFRLEREGARLLPDVIITPGTKGWLEKRVLEYGIDTGRLDEEGNPAGGWENGRARSRVEDGTLPAMRRLVEEKYSAPPKVYLGSAHCSYLYDNTELAVLFLRKRNSFMPAQVAVGSRFFGWDEAEVIRFGRQTGRLDDPAVLKKWAVRRTEEFGLDPNTPWVVELLGEDNLPVYVPPSWAEGPGLSPSDTP
jgi:predicted DNA-binding transcriptional regulator AlpA